MAVGRKTKTKTCACQVTSPAMNCSVLCAVLFGGEVMRFLLTKRLVRLSAITIHMCFNFARFIFADLQFQNLQLLAIVVIHVYCV